MHIKENILNFLYDKDYFITIYERYIYVFNYQELIAINGENIKLKLPKFKLAIEGSDLFITQMDPKEILIKGNITKVGFIYD